MTFLESAKKTVRKNLRHYKQHAHNSKWRTIIDAALEDFTTEQPGKALILKEAFISGRARHRLNYCGIAAKLHISTPTVSVWMDEIVQEIALRASQERLI